MEGNRIYAEKLASTTDDYFDNSLKMLKYSASLLGKHGNDPDFLLGEVNRLGVQSENFSSVIIVDDKNVIVSTYPETLLTKGAQSTLGIINKQMVEKGEYISEPYISTSGNYIIAMSVPFFSPQGKYLGFIAGSVYLRRDNILNRLMMSHFYYDDSAVYIVGSNGMILFSKNDKLIGTYLNFPNFKREDIKGVILSDLYGNSTLAGFSTVKKHLGQSS